MRHYATAVEIRTDGRGTIEITQKIQQIVAHTGVRAGLCTVFVHHTSASIILCENADPAVRRDLEVWAGRLAPDGDPEFRHRDEGPDDMPAHLRTIASHSSITVPIASGRCDFGTWQGIYLWEHRLAGHTRRITVTVIGE